MYSYVFLMLMPVPTSKPSQNHPKTIPKPDFEDLFNKSDFYKNEKRAWAYPDFEIKLRPLGDPKLYSKN